MSIWSDATCDPCTADDEIRWHALAVDLSELARGIHPQAKDLAAVQALDLSIASAPPPGEDPAWLELLWTRGADVRDLVVNYALIGVEAGRKGPDTLGAKSPGCVVLCKVEQARSKIIWDVVADVVAGIQEDPEGLPIPWAKVGPRPLADDPTNLEYIAEAASWWRTFSEIQSYAMGGYAVVHKLDFPPKRRGGAAAILLFGVGVWLWTRRR